MSEGLINPALWREVEELCAATKFGSCELLLMIQHGKPVRIEVRSVTRSIMGLPKKSLTTPEE